MNNAAVKVILKRYRYLERLTDRKVQELQEFKDRQCKITQTLSPAPGGSKKTRDEIGEFIAEMEERQLEMIDFLRKTEREKAEIKSLIESVEDKNVQNILWRRYIEGYKWEEVCVQVGYSWSETHRKHAAGLKAVRKEIERRQKQGTGGKWNKKG